jgi:hypothetical protein
MLLFNNLQHLGSPIPTHYVSLRTSLPDSELIEKLKQIDVPKDAIFQPYIIPQSFYIGHFIYTALIFLIFVGLVRFFKSRVKSDDHDA